MKVILKPIEMVATFDTTGAVLPIRFRLETDDHTLQILRILKIIVPSEEKIAGNPMRVYTCLVDLHGEERHCEIRYEMLTCKWVLFKI